jgi:hypothetical protein
MNVADIPSVMRKKSWYVGARLMDRWFSRAPAIAPNYGPPVTDIVTMKWALAFERAKNAFWDLAKNGLWNNVAAQKEITAMLGRNGYLSSFQGTRTFGDLTQPPPVLDENYINFRAVGGGYYEYVPYTDLDDMTAALGAFVFRLAVAGTVGPSLLEQPGTCGGSWGWDVSVQEIAIYIKDSYDFNGTQPLGFWDDDDAGVTPGFWGIMLPGILGRDLVTNGDFRDYRDENNVGGDFLVFSDVTRLTFAEPFIFNTNLFSNNRNDWKGFR